MATAAETVGEDRRTPAQRAMDDRDWSFGGAWPYAPRWHHAEAVRLHYVDEGPPDGTPVVLLHGNATWSFLYRELIASLGDAGMRAVALDQLGFGRSDKPHRLREYSLERHCRLFDSLLEELALDDVTVVAHGWGGPVALSWATRHAERMRGLVLLNAFVQPPKPGGAGLGAWLLVKGAHRGLRDTVWADPAAEQLGPDERRAYAAPHPSWDSRSGILAFERAGSGRRGAAARSLTEATVARLGSLEEVSTAIIWGMEDATQPAGTLDGLSAALPGAAVQELEGVGHLVPESAPSRVLDAVLSAGRQAVA